MAREGRERAGYSGWRRVGGNKERLDARKKGGEVGAGSGCAPLLVLMQAVQDRFARCCMQRAELGHISSTDGVQSGRLELQGCAAFGAQLSSFCAGLAPRFGGAEAVVDLVVAADHVLAQHKRIAAANVGDNFRDNSLLKLAMVG